MNRLTLLKFLAGILFFLLPQLLLAHDARPVVVIIAEQFPGVYQFTVRVPDTVEANNQPAVAWPEGCVEQGLVSSIAFSSGSVICEGSSNGNMESGLQGKPLSLDFPFYNPSLATFYRFTTLDGETMTSMLSPTRSQWLVPREPSRGNVALQYLSLGIEHIIGGLDHLLFVFGLLVIARSMKRILWTVTGFTIAHSITLSLSALGLVSIPIAPVEAVIALSIVFLAYEISREHNDSLTYKYPLIVSFGFGLLHGLGFASALGEIGLVQNEILVSLLFFNLGVETGQIAFILVVVAVYWCLRWLLPRLSPFLHVHWWKNLGSADRWLSRRLDLPVAYLIGIPASYWLIDRVVQFL